MNEPGIVNHHAQLLQWLKNRLLLTDLLARHPEIHDIELLPPLVIAGLPRTGTTHLHNLLAAAPTFRTMPYWESNEPFPLPAEAGIEPDPRKARMDVAVQVINLVMPHFPLMHEMTTDHVHEEIQLLANDFSTMLFETLAHVPRWRDYYMAHDQTSHYEYLRDAAQGDAVSAWRSALAAQIAATPRAAAGAEQGLPRRLRHIHPPRPRAGDAVDAGDAHLQRAHVLLAGAGEGDRGDLGRSAGSDARRAGPRSRHHPAGPLDRRPLRRIHGRRARGRRAGVPARPASSWTTMPARRSPTIWPGINAAGTERLRRRPRCSASTSATCASLSLRTSSVFSPDLRRPRRAAR